MPNVVVQTEMDSITEILADNQDKNFIQRILKPNEFPVLQSETNKDTVHTHLMSDSEVDGKFYVYPAVVFRDGELEKLGAEEALDYALETGELIELPTQEAATWFAKNYKKFWEE